MQELIEYFVHNWKSPSDPKFKMFADIMLYTSPFILPLLDKYLVTITDNGTSHAVVLSYMIFVAVFKGLVKALTNTNKIA